MDSWLLKLGKGLINGIDHKMFIISTVLQMLPLERLRRITTEEQCTFTMGMPVVLYLSTLWYVTLLFVIPI